MNKVTFYRLADGSLTGFRARGHSGFDVEGRDIVCAALSALSITFANGLTDVLKIPAAVSQDERKASLQALIAPEATQAQIEAAQPLLNTYLLGVRAIEDQYPHNVAISYEERRL